MSFCTSCIVSHQVVADGDPCRLFFIRQNSYVNPVVVVDGEASMVQPGVPLTVGAGAEWAPLSRSFAVNYYDHGLFSLDPADVGKARVLFGEILSDLCDSSDPGHPDDPSRGFSVASFAETLTSDVAGAWAMFCRAAGRGVLFSRSFHNDGPMPVRFAAMHDSAYLHLLSNARDHRGADTPERRVADALCVVDKAMAKTPVGSPETSAMVAASRAMCRLWPSDCSLVTDAPVGYVEDLLVSYALGQRADETRAAVAASLAGFFEDGVVMTAMDAFALRFEPNRYASSDCANGAGTGYAALVAHVEKQVRAARGGCGGDQEAAGPV